MADEILETSVETSEVAEQTEETVESEVETEESAETPEAAEPVEDENAKYAAARRKAEEANKKRDERVAKRFGNLKHPITGKAITTVDEYFDALDAQEDLQRKQQLKDAGIDPAMLDEAINNSPIVRQAQETMERIQQEEGRKLLNEQVAEISKLYPDVKTLDDIFAMDTYEAFDGYVKNGLNLVEAFTLANFDKLKAQSTAATKQAAINAAKSKSHLNPIGDTKAGGESLKEIPESELARWKAFFPKATAKELREKYNRVHK